MFLVLPLARAHALAVGTSGRFYNHLLALFLTKPPYLVQHPPVLQPVARAELERDPRGIQPHIARCHKHHLWGKSIRIPGGGAI